MAITVGIVNDMKMAGIVLGRVISAEPDMQVAWLATSGSEAVARCASERPDVVLMDLVMPGMDGAEATRQIMAHSPCRILIVTATQNGHAELVFEAMGHGALDVCTTPVIGDRRDADDGFELRRKIRAICGLRVQDGAIARRDPEAAVRATVTGPPLVALGASTGGPAALAEILSALPRALPVPIAIVQHIDNDFVPGLGDWLATRSGQLVSLADAGDRLVAGRVYLSRSHQHLVLRSGGVLDYQVEPSDYFYRPSVNVLFDSVARHGARGSIGVLLTGMGRDGAEGLLAMRQAGHHTIAQDQSSSVVYGMPAAAAAIGAADEILPLALVASRIGSLCQEALP